MKFLIKSLVILLECLFVYKLTLGLLNVLEGCFYIRNSAVIDQIDIGLAHMEVHLGSELNMVERL